MGFAQKQDLKLVIQPNQRISLRKISKVDQDVSVPGQGAMKVITTSTMEVAFYATAIKDGNYVINGIINKMEINTSNNGKTTVISGSDSVETAMNKDLRAITGKTFVAEVTPKFELVGDIKALKEEEMTPETAKKAFEILASFFEGVYPPQPLAKGESFPYEGKELGAKGTITLGEVGENTCVFDGVMKINGNIQGVDMKGDATINYEIHRATGIPLNGLSTTQALGSVATPQGAVSIKINATESFEFMQ